MTENTDKDITPEAMEAAAALEAIASGQIEEAIHPEGIEMTEWVFTNDKTNPAPRQLFHLFYQGAFANKLGIMHAKLKDKDEIQTLIVGINVQDGQISCFPLAKVLTEDEQSNYLYPDGNGNFLGE